MKQKNIPQTEEDFAEFRGDRHGRSGRGGRGHHEGHGRHGKHHGGVGRRRLFDYGELRLLVLALIAEEPHHGYELIKMIEDRFEGTYSPSPGVIYPTLSWLDDMGYAQVQPNENGRKNYEITEEGQSFLKANANAMDELLSRRSVEPSHERPAPIVRAMNDLKMALRLRARKGPFDEAALDKITAAIDAAAKEVELS